MNTEWMTEGACAQTDPEAFFPEKGDSISAAKRVCQNCPVKRQCLDYAIDTHQWQGVWGGLTVRDIRKARKAREAT